MKVSVTRTKNGHTKPGTLQDVLTALYWWFRASVMVDPRYSVKIETIEEPDNREIKRR